jgi:hypothetical protein
MGAFVLDVMATCFYLDETRSAKLAHKKGITYFFAAGYRAT